MISYTISKQELYKAFAGEDVRYETAELPGENDFTDHDAVLAEIIAGVLDSRRPGEAA